MKTKTKKKSTLSSREIKAFRKKVYAYFHAHPRPMPWRATVSPYNVLVSEIMLQQTQVERVIDKFNNFIRLFPDIGTLARAPLSRVLAAWQGLGYNRRAVSLQKCAQVIVRDHAGSLPDDTELLVDLPGIGPATARSICAFAFNKPVVFIETNIRSVYIHHFFSEKKNVHDDEILPLVRDTLDRKDPRTWYSALMDYGVHLKKEGINPSRRSSHYYKQSPFKGSNREVRGRILKLVLKDPFNDETELAKATGFSITRARKAIRELIKEGLVRRDGKRIRI